MANAASINLRISDNGRYLIKENGEPFFYLGDTAWELFHRLDREDASYYLEDRAKKGFTVIQAVALAELVGLGVPNPYGHFPLIDEDPTRPDVKEGPDNDYWDHVDWVIEKAESLGLVIALLPTWGDKWNPKWATNSKVIFTPENARIFGKWIGERYQDRSIIWVVGGDRPIETDEHRAIVESMAEGIREGDKGKRLMTFHPMGGQSSSRYFHDAPWLDFNMQQNGHEVVFEPRYADIRKDYDRLPTKPVIDGEPVYEDHPISFRPDELGHTIAADVRRPLYWDLFSGAFGHTYGHHSVWQMHTDGSPGVNRPLMDWKRALQQPGAGQMQYGRWLMESRPFLTRIPDDSIIVSHEYPSAVPGAGMHRMVATRDSEGSWAAVYTPVGRAFSVRLDVINGPIKAWWYNPRNGEATLVGEYSNEGEQEFQTPTPGEMLDWVLVLDEKSKNFPAPGVIK